MFYVKEHDIFLWKTTLKKRKTLKNSLFVNMEYLQKNSKESPLYKTENNITFNNIMTFFLRN